MYTKVVEIKSFVKRRGEISRIKMFKPKKNSFRCLHKICMTPLKKKKRKKKLYYVS